MVLIVSARLAPCQRQCEFCNFESQTGIHWASLFYGCALSGLHSQPLMVYGCALSGLPSQPLMVYGCALSGLPSQPLMEGPDRVREIRNILCEPIEVNLGRHAARYGGAVCSPRVRPNAVRLDQRVQRF